MSTILFKGKRTDNGEWVEGNLLNESTIRDHRKGSLVETVNCSTECKFSCDGFRVDPSTVCQYIGRDDKNRKKVFKGDILQDQYIDKHIEDTINYKIDWDDITASFKILDGYYPMCFSEGGSETFGKFACHDECRNIEEVVDLVVIGNIHDKK